MIKFYDKLYVIKRSPDHGWYEQCPDLGFMCHYEENAAFEKRQATMQHWAYRSYKSGDPDNLSFIVDNEPVSGFSIKGSVSRWTTSNKLLRIEDPRGFILEISIENFYDILVKCTMVNGVIEEPLVWGRDGANNVLVHVDHEDYLNRSNDFKPKVGDYFKKDGNHYRYLGKFYAHTISKDHQYEYHGYGWNRKRETLISYSDEGLDSKVFHLYEEEPKSWREDPIKAELRARRSVMKDCQEPDPDVSWDSLDLNSDWVEYRFDSTTASGWYRKAKFYPKKVKVEPMSEENIKREFGDV